MSVKISYNHSTNLYTIYTDMGSLSFGGFSELQELLEKENFSFLNEYALNKTFLRNVARKHHGGRGATRRFDVSLKADVRNKVYSYKKSNNKSERLKLYADQISDCKYNMNVCVDKARAKKDLQYFLAYKDFYIDYIYYTTGKRYLSKANESALLKRFLNLVN